MERNSFDAAAQRPDGDLFRRLSLFLLALALLAGPHFGVEAILAEQLGVGAALGDAALVEHDDLIGVDHGRETVGDDDRGAPRGDALQGLLDRALGAAVERA